MVALGYVHAQDRLWQMELMRIAPGRLSEIFGKWPEKHQFCGFRYRRCLFAIAALIKKVQAIN
jgi:hypothetical protein